MYYVYVIKSVKYNRIYIGMTSDIDKRINEHNSGKTKSTKHYLPWQLIHSEMLSSRKEARIKEKKLKTGCYREFF